MYLHGAKTINKRKAIDDVPNTLKLYLNIDIILEKLSSFNDDCIMITKLIFNRANLNPIEKGWIYAERKLFLFLGNDFFADVMAHRRTLFNDYCKTQKIKLLCTQPVFCTR